LMQPFACAAEENASAKTAARMNGAFIVFSMMTIEGTIFWSAAGSNLGLVQARRILHFAALLMKKGKSRKPDSDDHEKRHR
jgi:hypothetical protein